MGVTAGPPRRLVLMRHGVTEYNYADIVQGQLDIPLSQEGQRQAALAAPWVARLRPSLIMSSDLRRASHTAFAVGTRLGLDVVLDQRLRESASGSWEGLPVSQLDPVPDWATFSVDTPRGGDGESMRDVMVRVTPLLRELPGQLPPGSTALLVTHGVTARACVAALLGLDPGVVWTTFTGLRNCAWAVLKESAVGWRLRGWNLTAPDRDDLGLSADSG